MLFGPANLSPTSIICALAVPPDELLSDRQIGYSRVKTINSSADGRGEVFDRAFLED
jgi:hypothetical protein